jgi:CubicO group peptidase (beta-lactamase class C family)
MFVQATSTSVLAAAMATGLRSPTTPAERVGPAAATAGGNAFAELEELIRTAMTAYRIPGVAVGVLHEGVEYVKGFGVTNVDYPVPVDTDTMFRIASTTKTFTGTAVMRLVDRGLIDLDARVHRYLPELRTSDPDVARRVTVRQILNHTPGWVGESLLDTGPGDDAAARYVAGIADLPQLTPPGEVFAYNNAALALAGRLIEVVTRTPYETAMRELVIDPLGLDHSRFFTDEIIGRNIAASHVIDGDTPVVSPESFRLWRSLNASGGLISSVRDQLRWARFHLGDGTVPDSGTRLLTRRSLHEMRARHGPGGTMVVELDGMGVAWQLRPSAEGVQILQHGGSWAGQYSGFLMVPDRGFALTVLTNSESGPALLEPLFGDDWALRLFTGLHNLPANPQKLPAARLAPYEGTYTQSVIIPDGQTLTLAYDIRADDGRLVLYSDGAAVASLAFYRPDYVLVIGPDGEPTSSRADFVRDRSGEVAWLRLGGRLSSRESSGTRPTTPTPSAASTDQPRFDWRRPWASTMLPPR